jgi:hypothetical protein
MFVVFSWHLIVFGSSYCDKQVSVNSMCLVVNPSLTEQYQKMSTGAEESILFVVT